MNFKNIIKCCILILFVLNIGIINSSEVINIYPINKKQSTGIYVRRGDKLKFKVSGQWKLWDKYDLVGGEGHQFNANEYGNWGALLGKIGNSEPFVIGKGTEIESNFDGILYLFPNKGKYKISNQTGNLEVAIDGGIQLDKYIKQLSYRAIKITVDPKTGFVPTNLYVKKGETLEIYAFGEWTMWDEVYPMVSAEGHDFVANGVNWGKLYGGVGSSFGQFYETFSVGEKTKYRAGESGILSFYPYLNEYETIPNGQLELYIIGGKEVNEGIAKDVDELYVQNIEQNLLNKINEIRNSTSLPDIQINEKLSKTAFNHAKYMIANETFDRIEESGKSFFTGETVEVRVKNEGYEGKVREMFSDSLDPNTSVDLFIDTVYHRLRLLNPDLKYIGYGVYKNNNKAINVFDFGYKSDDEEVLEWDNIIYPPNEATEVKVGWTGIEYPDPFPTGTNKPLGYPVSIMFNKELKKVIDAEILGENGKFVSSFVITPGTDLNNKKFNAIIIVPKLTLDYNTRYTVNIKVKLGKDEEEKSYSWSFITQKEVF